MIDQPLGYGAAIFKWIVAQKFDHSSHVTDTRLTVVLLPIDDAHFIAPDHFCRVYLTKAQIEATLPNHFSDGFRELRIAGG